MNKKQSYHPNRLTLLTSWALLPFITIGCQPEQSLTYSDPRPQFDSHAKAGTYDDFAWELFLHVNTPAKSGKRGMASENAQLGQGPTLWETWKDLRETMRRDGAPPLPWDDPPPTDESSEERYFRSLGFYNSDLVPQVDGYHLKDRKCGLTYFGLRTNRPTFEYIVSRKLYNDNGLLDYFNTPSAPVIEFPNTSMQIKSSWLKLDQEQYESQKNSFYITTLTFPPTGKPHHFALIGLHVMAKTIRNWFWTTFEHKDNQTNTLAPETVPIAPATIRINQKWHRTLRGSVWTNYNLRGSQWSFVDSQDRPTLLSNTTIESRFQKTSSCITCHALASRGSDTAPFIPFLRITPTNDQEAYVGNPPWHLYCEPKQPGPTPGNSASNGEEYCRQAGLRYRYRSTDYAWIFRLSFRLRQKGF